VNQLFDRDGSHVRHGSRAALAEQKMSILNIGSVNIDHVYKVDHFVRPGETLSSTQYDIFAGGKGFNQSIALARAGALARHVGSVGRDAAWLIERLRCEGVDIAHLKANDMPTGHAIIQLAPTGENAIVLHGGANNAITAEDVVRAVASVSRGDFMLVQNETSAVAAAIRLGKRSGLKVVFNPAPMSPVVRDYPLQDVDIFVLNETEAEGLTGQITPELVRAAMVTSFPHAATVLTLGQEGAVFMDAAGILRQPGFAVKAIDTTAAGDTFIGYFLAEFMRTGEPVKALALGCRAAAISVTRPGASDSIPRLSEVRDTKETNNE
jgi:ribokinase